MVGGTKLVRMPVVIDVVSIYVLEVHSVWSERGSRGLERAGAGVSVLTLQN